MVNKFLVFVVFAIVTQSSVLLSSATFNEFPVAAYALLDLLESENYIARERSFSGYSAFVNLLKNGTGHASSYQDFTPFSEALSVAAESTHIIYYSTIFISRGDCDGYEAALNATRDQLNQVGESLLSSVALAKGGNYDENQSEIENDRDSTETGYVSAYGTLFEFLRCCISDSSEEFETLIGEVQAKVNENLHLKTVALYEAIEAYSILTSECTEEEAAAALACIDKSLFIIIVTSINNIEHIYALYETSYIDDFLNGDGVAQGVFEIRLARQRTSDKLEAALDVVFAAIIGRLPGYTSHHGTESSNSTIADPTKDIATVLLQSGNEYFLKTILLLLPNSTDNVKAAEIIVPHALSRIIQLYYDAIDLAVAGLPHRLALPVIKSVEDVASLETNVVVQNFFGVIGSDPNTEARFVDLQYRVIARLLTADDAVYDAIIVLSKADHENEGSSQEELDDIQIYRSLGVEAVRGAAKVQWYAVLYRYIAAMGY